jgi:cyclophilin family peptidyl-prolyl cis-trans isomerase
MVRPVSRPLSFSLSASLLVLTGSQLVQTSWGQASDTPLTPGELTTPPARPAPAAAPTVPPEIQAIKLELDEVERYLRRKGTVSKDDRPALTKILDKVRPYAQTKQPLALAMQVQIATWLEDHALVDATYGEILALNPANEIALSQWFSALNRRGDFERCVAEALTRNAQVAGSPRTTVPVVEAFLSLNRIPEAKLRLDALTLAPTERPDVSSRVNALKTRLDALLPLWQAEDALRQADEKAGNLPRVELVTSKGAIVVELFEDQAPNSVAAFLGFTEGGLYNGTSFHKRVPNVGLVGGDPNSKAGSTGRPGAGTPGYRIADEAGRTDRRMALAGTIGLAKAEQSPVGPDGTPTSRTVKDSAGQTFFVLTAPSEHLHGECTIIGRVVEGLEYLSMLHPNDRIESAKVLRKREHEYTVTKAPELPTAPELTVLSATPAAPRPQATPNVIQPAPLATPPSR